MNLCINCKHVLVFNETFFLLEEILCNRETNVFISKVTGRKFRPSCYLERNGISELDGTCGIEGIYFESKEKP